MTENEIAEKILDAAFDIHRELGPGLLESVYEAVLARALIRNRLAVELQKLVTITYQDLIFDEGFRADLIIEGKVIVELKSVEQLLRDGIKRVANGLGHATAQRSPRNET